MSDCSANGRDYSKVPRPHEIRLNFGTDPSSQVEAFEKIRACTRRMKKHGPVYTVYEFSCCGEWAENRTDGGASEIGDEVCPMCGAYVYEPDELPTDKTSHRPTTEEGTEMSDETMHHVLKTSPSLAIDILSGAKTFEVREDLGFRSEDTVNYILNANPYEWPAEEFQSASKLEDKTYKITHVARHADSRSIKRGFAVFSIKEVD